MSGHEFEPGEYIVYQNGDRFELGKIKRLTEDGAFVWYHEGETASKTPFGCIHKLVNSFVIKADSLGGEAAEKTNGDMVRAMPNKDLAAFTKGTCPPDPISCNPGIGCYSCRLRWLNQERKGDEDGSGI